MGKGRVAVLGGGIAGLTAAHELILRDFEVTIYETNERTDVASHLGGKAKTQFSQRAGLDSLPGEHGFRFFPSFYRHVVETMSRIPLQLDAASKALGTHDVPAGGNVAQRLIRSFEGAIGRSGENLTIVDRSPVDSIGDVTTLLQVWTDGYRLPALELVHLLGKLCIYYASCNARRDQEWQKLTLWEFFEADKLSKRTQDFINDMPKILAAMDAKEGNARSLLNTLFLWSLDFVKDRPADRILSGPTTKAWLEPWVAYLESRGVAFESGPPATVTGFSRDGKRVVAAMTAAGVDIQADFFICALPLDVVHAVCDPVLREASPPLDKLLKLPARASLRNMVGVQFFLNAPRPLVKGLVNYMGSEWGVTSLCEPQYWDSSVYKLPEDCSEVFSAIATKLPLDDQNNIDLTIEQVKGRFLELLSGYTGPDGAPLVDQAKLIHIHIDKELENAPGGHGLVNHTPHLIHPPAFQAVRVDPDIELENLFMAGDHVSSNTDVATMESANETGRNAVNALLRRLGLGDKCETFDLLAIEEPKWLKDLKAKDPYPGPLDNQLLELEQLQPPSADKSAFAAAVRPDAQGKRRFRFDEASEIERDVMQSIKAPDKFGK